MVQVKVSDGILEGEYVENDMAKYYSFKGIPFAQPPVGDLRFKPPQPVIPWDGVRSAKEHSSICYQINAFTSVISGSEDCLYLNVYTPKIKPIEPLPVMVFIHGGGFIGGCGDDAFYGPEFLVSNDVILVTCNYRIEVIGFLCLDCEDIPGNAGMKDQVAALKWVQNNISNFGGNPDNVTLFGESAGAVSVSFHLFSPMTKGLFKRAIVQSGASTNWWNPTFEPREVALAIARKLGCYSEDNKVLYEFFKNQPIESLCQVGVALTLAEKGKELFDPCFGVVSEKDFGTNERFFYGDSYDVLRTGIHEGVDVITGFTEDEGLLGLKLISDLEKAIDAINAYNDYFVPRPLALNCTAPQKLAIGKKIKKYYFGERKITLADVNQLVKYFSMDIFIYGIMQWAKICANGKKNQVYLYKFTCKSERNVVSQLLGVQKFAEDKITVCHADDIGYLFPMKVANIKLEKSSPTFSTISSITKLWTNFAKYGNPTPDDSLAITWEPFTVEEQTTLDIGNQLAVTTFKDDEEIAFWEDIFREYYPKYVHDGSG